MAVDLSRGAGYGNTLTWSAEDKSHPAAQLVEIQDDLNLDKFYAMFVALMTAPTPSH